MHAPSARTTARPIRQSLEQRLASLPFPNRSVANQVTSLVFSPLFAAVSRVRESYAQSVKMAIRTVGMPKPSPSPRANSSAPPPWQTMLPLLLSPVPQVLPWFDLSSVLVMELPSPSIDCPPPPPPAFDVSSSSEVSDGLSVSEVAGYPDARIS